MLDETNSPINSCRICGSTELRILIRDLPKAGHTWNIYSCNSCGFGTTSPLPDKTILSSLYSEGYWDPSTEKIIDAFYALRMRSYVLRLRKLCHRGARALDVGAGNGDWVRLMTKAGFNALGIDPYASEAENTAIYKSDLDAAPFKPESFDLITFMNVLEHLRNPVNSIRQAIRLLRPGGLLAIEVPNLNSFGFSWFQTRWYPLDVPWHINHFTPSSLRLTLNQAGVFKILYLSGFSLRDCPSSLANSFFPWLAPRAVRERFGGTYPFHLKLAYFLVQAACLPVSVSAAVAGRGEIIRAIFKYV